MRGSFDLRYTTDQTNAVMAFTGVAAEVASMTSV
jgi:hypothetical protein